MASEAPKDSETKTREIKPITQPIVPLTAPAAQTFIHVHPLLLSAYFLLRFPYLVADPVSALLKDLFPIAAIQCAYAAICLPVSKRSGSSSDPSSTTASTPSKTKATPKPRGSKASSIDPNDATPATRITVRLPLHPCSRASPSPPTSILTLSLYLPECPSVPPPNRHRLCANLLPPRPLRCPNNHAPTTHLPHRRALCLARLLPALLRARR